MSGNNEKRLCKECNSAIEFYKGKWRHSNPSDHKPVFLGLVTDNVLQQDKNLLQ
jgi:hypothetical protein